MLLSMASVAGASATTMSPAIPFDIDIEAKVNEIVSKMSLDDKVGQMCEVTIDVVCADNQPDGAPRLDPGKSRPRSADTVSVPSSTLPRDMRRLPRYGMRS